MPDPKDLDSGPKWDLFISHASEDKDAIARPLALELEGRGLDVWYDETSLTAGDSLRQSIEQGLARSRFGVVVLSPVFFEKFWTGSELDGLFAREEVEGRKVMVPIWHNIEKPELVARAPMLANRFALQSTLPLDELAVRVMDAMKSGAPGSAVPLRAPVVALTATMRAVGKTVFVELHNPSREHASNVHLEPRLITGRGVPIGVDHAQAVGAGTTRVLELDRFEGEGEAEAVYDLIYTDKNERVLKRQKLRFFMGPDVVIGRDFVSLAMERVGREDSYLASMYSSSDRSEHGLVQAFLAKDGFLLTGSTQYVRWLQQFAAER